MTAPTRTAGFRARMLSGELLCGTFLKTPAYELVEVLAQSELDFICLDGEHAPFDRARMDQCLAIARALDLPVLVRVGASTPENVLQALDSGAVGIVAPHIDSPAKAQELARMARFGHGGRGYAGSSRWAGFATRGMPDLLAQSRDETVVIAQIEEPEAVDRVDQIAAIEGVDGLFVGPADLSVAYGYNHQTSEELAAAFARVGTAAREAGKTCMTFAAKPEATDALKAAGVTMFFMASEQSWLRDTASDVARRLRG